MSMHNDNGNRSEDRETSSQKREQPDASAGFERTDVKAKGIIIFLFAMVLFAVFTGFLSYGIGKLLFAHMAKEDGPKSKWATTVDLRPLGNMANSPDLKSKMDASVQNFPTPQLQTDDGSQEIMDLHEKEDLLLENYSWADQAQGKVRIPIERAMELVARSGLPVAPQVEKEPLMMGDSRPEVATPLTNGFARTGYEQEETQARSGPGKSAESKK